MQLLHGHEGWVDVAIWGIIGGIAMLALIVLGIVLIVKYATGRPKGGTQCTGCGIHVAPGNTHCPGCEAEMNWG